MFGKFGKNDRRDLFDDKRHKVVGYIYAFKPDEQDPRYSVIEISGAVDADGDIVNSTRPGILVSTREADQIEADNEARQQKEREEAERKDAARMAELGREFDQELHKHSRTSPFGAAGLATGALKRHGVELPDLDKDQAKLKFPQPGIDYDPLTAMPVYSPDEPIKMLRTTLSTTPDKERLEARVALYNEIMPKGSVRKLGAPANIEALQQLERGFPHFKRVLKMIHNQVKLAERTGRTLKLPPMLLLGEAGVGKTEFTHQLSRLFGSPVKRMPFDNDEVPSSLLGSAKHWSTSTAGTVFEALVKGTHANPILLLDEIDKAHRNSYRGDPLASLHSLLETSTNNAVRDISADFDMDASHVIWIATANHRDQVPDTILSRLTEFTIQRPTGQHAIQLAQVVAERILEELDLKPLGFGMPKPELIRLMASYTPREQGKAWREAFASAVAADRCEVWEMDMPETIITNKLVKGSMSLPWPQPEEGESGNKGKGDRPAPTR